MSMLKLASQFSRQQQIKTMATQQAVKIQAVKDVQQSIVDGVRRLRSLGIQSRRIANSMNLIMQASQELQYYIMESSYPAGTYPEGK